MSCSRHQQRRHGWQGPLAGVVAGLAGALAMNLYARGVRSIMGGREAAGAAPGPQRDGRGMQPPQADTTADDDGAVRAGRAGYRMVTGRLPSHAIEPALGTAAHYAFGAAVGGCYGLLAERMPLLRTGFGTVYGSTVWLAADEGMMPALGWSKRPDELTPAVHLYSLVGHWVYGATLESVRRLAAG
jgi:putative membrane protein